MCLLVICANLFIHFCYFFLCCRLCAYYGKFLIFFSAVRPRIHVACPSRSSVVDLGRMRCRVLFSYSCLRFSFSFSLNMVLRVSRPASLGLLSLFSIPRLDLTRGVSASFTRCEDRYVHSLVQLFRIAASSTPICPIWGDIYHT